LSNNITYSDFHFENYRIAESDYSGNKITGVPDWTIAENMNIDFPKGISLFIQYYYSSKIPLNDANLEYANEYHLIQMKTTWRKKFDRFGLSFSLGVDNLLDQKYSLGNDLNAAGGRYYNPAPKRNYYAMVGLVF
jgi:iron complex outermembrane recepter protein